jgi:hypothetical protein
VSDVWVVRDTEGRALSVELSHGDAMDETIYSGHVITCETLLTPAHAAVIAAAEAWDHYFFDSRLNKNRQMREDDLHYALMKLRATTSTEATP